LFNFYIIIELFLQSPAEDSSIEALLVKMRQLHDFGGNVENDGIGCQPETKPTEGVLMNYAFYK
jgi:hypothetical protein